MSDLNWCIDYLKNFNEQNTINVSYDFNTFRALLNVTMPEDLSDEFYKRQDNVLKSVLSEKNIIDSSDFENGISLYRGDITLIKADAIVNAANSSLLGCFIPLHSCIDNAIHSFAGLEVRRDLLKVRKEQNHDEKCGGCKVTPSYNLPSRYIFHTVGPVYSGKAENEIDLRNCYLSCLEKADEMNLKSIVFPSISTGVFGFPIEKASKIAIGTVCNYLCTTNKNIKKVIFDVFSENDEKIYNNNISQMKIYSLMEKHEELLDYLKDR